jgi:hypothetical protein
MTGNIFHFWPEASRQTAEYQEILNRCSHMNNSLDTKPDTPKTSFPGLRSFFAGLWKSFAWSRQLTNTSNTSMRRKRRSF